MTRPRVIIIGGGPAGLVLAHAFAKRDSFDLTVVDRELNPFESPTTTDRSYTIDITGHGLRAVRYLDAVERFDQQLIRFKGIQAHRPIRRTIPWTELGWTGSRGDILRTLMGDLEAKWPGRVRFQWNAKVDRIDIEAGEVVIDGNTEQFDFIFGCDGAGSITREAMEAVPGFTTEKASLPNYCMMVALDQNTASMDPEYLHVMNAHPFTVAGAVNGRDKSEPKWFCMVGFNHPHRFGSGCCGKNSDAIDEARRYVDRHTDMLQFISEDELARFVERDCHHVGKSVKCSAFHAGKGVLLGDAAAAFPPIGQGINAAMESAIVFDQLLGDDECEISADDFLAAAARFSADWKPEADAALWIASRWTFSNVRTSARVLIAELLDCNVMNQAKHMDYSEVHRQAQRRLNRLGPLKSLVGP
jgi:2-polyprenyl-6-methoxyphenol hydroxylase-like FAD-dependent oxidoreductase